MVIVTEMLVLKIYIKLWSDNSLKNTTRGNSENIFPQRAKLDIRRYGLDVRILSVWNNLSEGIVCANKLNSIKTNLIISERTNKCRPI